MKKASNMSKKLIAILLSAAMTFTPMMQSMPVYAAETQNETEDVGTMPQADELDDAVSDNDSDAGDAEEAPGEEQNPDAADAGDDAKDDVSDDHSKDDASDDGKDADTGKVEENTEEKTETKEDTKPSETVLDPVYEEVLEEESDSVSGSEEESETETEEMSLEDVGIASYSITPNDVTAGGWNESIYAEIPKVTDDSAITAVSWSGTASGELKGKDLEFLVRTIGNKGTRIDIPGLKAGKYTLSITVNGTANPVKKENIEVYAYDRSGYAHFNYTDGVGAYNDDGTLKAGAEVIYVTPDTVNTVALTVGTTTVKGIGNILNTVGKDCGDPQHPNKCKRVSKGKTYYGIANTNQGIIEKLSEANTPLVVRFIGTISESGLKEQAQYNANHEGLIDGLTAYNSDDYGGIPGDNGHMARIKSGKNITLEGIGYDAVIDGWGFHFMAESATASQGFGKGFEVRNLKFINTPEDAIGMEGIQENSKITAGVERCWIHNNEFYCPNIGSPAESDKAQGDGSVDFKRGQYFTCSYNYFEGCHKTNLVGSSDSSLQYNLTYHHNYWYMCEARGPLARQANIHMYNNIFDMQTSYAMNPRANSYIFSEYNMFYACKSPQDVDGGALKSYKDSISSVLWGGTKGTFVSDKSEYVPNNCQYLTTKYDKFDVESDKSYIPNNTNNKNYQLQEDYKELRQVIKSQTGVQAQKPKRPEAVTESDYSVVDRMVNATKATVNTFDALPQNIAPGKISKSVYAFEVGADFDLEITYADPAKAPGVLVNEEGANLLEGDGEVLELPAGKYMIQAVNFQPGKVSQGKVASIAVFKDMSISSLNITAHNPDAHYHKWVLNTEESKDPTCTEEGKKVYTCTEDCPDAPKTESIPALGHDWISSGTNAQNPTCTEAGEGNFKCSRTGCDATTSGTVPALGHSWGPWEVVTPATETTEGKEKRVCTRDEAHFQERDIPKGGTGTSTPGITVAGNYELYFDHQNRTPLGDTDFFTVSGSYSGTKGSATVNGTGYTSCLKMESSTTVSFSCNDEATLFMAFASTEVGKKVKVDGTEYTTDSQGTVTVGPLSAGKHTITKGDSINLFYISVDNGESSEVYYTLSFAYNYGEDAEEDEPLPKTIQVLEGSAYPTMEALAPVSFTRNGYNLKGLYKDAACTQAVTYPHVVNGNAKFYAQWEESDNDNALIEESYTLYFNTNGGSSFVPVSVLKSQVYQIKEVPTRTGYAFAGWYDAAEGGKIVSFVDGSQMTGDVTVYAHWNATETSHVLDCNREFTDGQNITQKTTINGFTIHALSGGVGGTPGDESTKYYMTATKVSNDNTIKLGTNGVLLSDRTIPGNEDGLLKSIEFTTEDKGTLTVEVELSGKGETGGPFNFVLAKQTSASPVDYTEIDATKFFPQVKNPVKQTWTYTIGEAGTYYIYPKTNKGVRYSKLTLTEEASGYTILFHAGMGTAPEGLTSVVKEAGDPVEIPGACTPVAGYIFKGWSVDGENVLTGPYTVSDDDADGGVITIMALYEAESYKIKYDGGLGTLPAELVQNATVSAGQTVILKDCTPPEGYKFKGWKVGSTDKMVKASYSVYGADADASKVITLTAVYEKEGTGDNEDPSDKKTGMEIVGVADSYEFTGAKIIPDIEVWDYDNNGGKLLAPDVDYKVTYKNNVKISTNETDPKKQPQVIVTGKGNYAGKGVTKSFEIKEAVKVTEGLINLKGAKIDKIPDEEYALELVNGNSKGKPHYPDFKLTVKKGDNKTTITETYEYDSAEGVYKVKEAEDTSRIGKPIAANVAVSNNVNKGTATILITGGKNKETDRNATSVKKTFKITAVDLSKADVEVGPIAPVEYAVNGAVPTGVNVTIKSDGKVFTLKQGKDYTVKYANNKKATTGQEKKATVTITGKGNFAKKYNKEKVEYEITPLKLSDLKVNAVTACEGVKPGKVKATVVDKNGAALKASQYVVKVYAAETGDALCEDTLAANATIYVAVEAKDVKNLTGATKREPFKVGKDFSKAKIVLNKGEDGKVITKEYTGSAINLTAGEITVSYRGETENLKPGKDYEIAECINNVNKGTATAIVKGIGDYSGTKTVKFKIVGKDMTINNRWTAWENFKGFLNGLTKQTK